MKDQTNQAAKLEAILSAAVDAIITIDVNGSIQSLNPAAETLFGYDEGELIGNNVKCLMPNPWASEHDGYLHHHKTTGENRIIGIGREVQGKRKDDSVFHMHLSVSEYKINEEVFYTGIIHDLTLRKQAEEGLIKAQKMEAVGQLTGGIAHDFNNLLTVLTGNLELLEMQLQDKNQLELLKEAQDAADLGSDLTNRLLAFARRSVLQPQQVDLNEQVNSMSSVLKRSLGGNIELNTVLEDELWSAMVDPGQFESVLLNLSVNARDAMPNGGALVIETSNTVVDDDYYLQETGVAKGSYVRVSVSDTGIGMEADVIARVFEPFFTTKGPGQGSGLGLSMVYGFARQSNGYATIYSELEIGTTVNIYLPKVDDGSIEEQSANNTPNAQPGEQQLILVVEDDPQVQRLTVQRLEILNYKTVTADNGAEALELLSKDNKIDLVFTDLVMPGGISGYELAEIVSKKHPKMPILMTSGYAEDLVHADELRLRSLKLLRKPYKLNELAELVQDILA